MTPDPVHVQVKAVPVDKECKDYLIECSECGVLPPVPAALVDDACLTHLEAHQVDTSKYREAQSTEPQPPEVPD